MIEAILPVLIIILAIIFFPLIIYLRYCIRYYRVQARLVYRPGLDLEVKSKDKTIEHEEINYQTTDGVTIFAWYVPYAANTPEEPDAEEVKEVALPATPPEHRGEHRGEHKGVILFCHGNIGNISQRIDSFKIFRELGFSSFIFDYRGYGKSIGKLSEEGTYLDAEGAWDYLVKKMKVKPEEIIVFGRSLGGAIASYLARKYPCRALILESTFTSAPDMAARMFPLLPTKLLTRFRYNTRKRLKDIHCPIMIIHSWDDELIPFNQGLSLFEEANPPKKFLRIKGEHLDGFLRTRTGYINGLREFISELPEPFLAPEGVEEISSKEISTY